MKYLKVISISVVFLLLLAQGQAYGLTIYTEVSGLGVYGSGADTILPRVPFTIEFYASFAPGDENRLSWSSPFLFYGTASVTALLDTGTLVRDSEFDDIWDMGAFADYRESWDGNLTNMAPGGDRPGDLFNYSGIDFNPPHLPSGGVMHLFDVEIPGIAGPSSYLGQFCIDSGDAVNNAYDWMFENPSPSFNEICRVVNACLCGWAYFVDCPTSVDTVHWNETYELILTTAAISNQSTYFSHLDDPTGHASFIVTDSTNDPNGQARFTFTPDCTDVGLQTFEVGVYIVFNPYPSGMECTFSVYVANDPPFMYGECGKILPVSYEYDDTLHSFHSVDPDAPDSALYYEAFCDSATGINALGDPCGCEPYSSYSIDSTGYFKYFPDSLDEGCINYFTIRVTDCCGDYSECWVGMMDIVGSCGDPNGDGLINIFDVVYIISYLYLDGPPPDPLESADVNNDGAINIFDVAYLISFLYLGGSPPTCP